MGFGFAYRYHLNQQNRDRFNPQQANTVITPFNITIAAPGPPGTTFTVPASTVLATTGAFPTNFRPSEDANGFIFQFWVGKRNERAPEYLPNQPPTVTLSASSSNINPPCPPGLIPTGGYTPSANGQVQLSANATDPDGDTLLYTYSTTGGQITGEGPNVTWNLDGATAGTYTATVEVDDGCGCVAFSSTTVTVATPNCVPPCPNLNVSCPTELINVGQPVTYTANVSGGDPNATVTYNWTVSSGTITCGQGTPSITVDTAGLTGGAQITGTVELGGVAPECTRTASCTVTLNVPPVPRKFDEYGNIAFNDEKARLDNFAIQLQNEPGAQGYIIAYGGRRGRTGEAQARADRAKDYLVNTRGLDPGRVVTVDGGYREDLTVELWIVPTGATPPTASPTVQASEVQIITGGTGRRRGRRRGHEE